MEWLPHTLESLSNQSLKDLKVWICVNQPESWWSSEEKRPVCENNAQLLQWLEQLTVGRVPSPDASTARWGHQPSNPMAGRCRAYSFDVQVIDRSSKGNGWKDRKGGVGAARRAVMDAIAENSDKQDIIVSLDGDTLLDPDYLAELTQSFADNPDAVGYTARYYHKLTGKPDIDRAMLRYEIYLRYYLINLQRIDSPYAFTAMGSALATTVKSYRRVGGMTPKKSAEDFYFLVKLAKSGRLIYGDNARVYPASRESERVIFGTGQAILNGFDIMRTRYPIFASALFDDIAATTAKFPDLFDRDIELPLSDFLRETLNCEDLWEGLRKNHTTRERFVRACHERVDGLRLFQYLRSNNNSAVRDEENLFRTLNTIFARQCAQLASPAAHDILEIDPASWSLDSAPIVELNELRYLLSAIEDVERVRINAKKP